MSFLKCLEAKHEHFRKVSERFTIIPIKNETRILMKVCRDCVGGEVYGNLSVLKLLYVYYRRQYAGETREMLNALI